MRHTLYNILLGTAMGALTVMGSSCTDYLDKEPSSEVSSEVGWLYSGIEPVIATRYTPGSGFSISILIVCSFI